MSDSAAVNSQTDCRSEDGVTVGLVDAIITLCRLIRTRNINQSDVLEALKDLASDEDFEYLQSVISTLKGDM